MVFDLKVGFMNNRTCHKMFWTGITIAMVVFLISACSAPLGRVENTPRLVFPKISVIQTVTFESPTSTLMSSSTAAPIPDFPIPLPCDFEAFSLQSHRIADDCSQTIKGKTYYDVKVNTIPVHETWMSLLSNDPSLVVPPDIVFSPDGQYLAVIHNPNYGYAGTIWIFRTSDWKQQTVFHMEYAWTGPIGWPSDSQSYAFFSMKLGKVPDLILPMYPIPEGNFVDLLNLDGTVTHLLSKDDIFPGRTSVIPEALDIRFGPAWSADGHTIAYVAIASGDVGDLQLNLMDTHSHKKETVYEGKMGDNPLWSPDGHKILLHSKQSLQVFDVNTRTMKTIVNAQEVVEPPKGQERSEEIYPYSFWSMDSQSVIFNIDGINRGGDFVINLNSGNVRRLDNGSLTIYQITPDGKQLIYDENGVLKVMPFEPEK
jgi:hypothetical protein